MCLCDNGRVEEANVNSRTRNGRLVRRMNWLSAPLFGGDVLGSAVRVVPEGLSASVRDNAEHEVRLLLNGIRGWCFYKAEKGLSLCRQETGEGRKKGRV